ncbi:MAG: DUF177 domain-containing protein [Clostridia bacterium]|nr:DUF177 domain-containing protein [Clostridia bacterium]
MILSLKAAFATENYSAPINFELNLSDIEFSGVYPLKKPIQISGELFNRAGVVVLRTHCKACYQAPCDRCGQECCNSVTVDKEYILATELENEDNDNILLVTEMELNLAELCRTDVLLHIPMKHLCHQDCKGLCSECGKNLNQGECGCNKKQIDPRLSKLAELLK